jgi:precorrin-6B methylase 2
LNLLKKIIRHLNYHRRETSIKKAHHLHRLRYKQDYIEIDENLSNFHYSGGLKHEYQAYKLWLLKRLLEKHKPERILEFGSGSSTLIFADFIRKHKGFLLSIDEDEKWASNTKNLINISKSDRIEIIVAKKKAITDAVPPEIKYSIDIKEKHDFVFIDGPSLRVNGKKVKNAINSNVLELTHDPKFIVVDVRKATAEYLSHKYTDKYNVNLSELFSGKPVGVNYNYFSVFVRE